MTSEIKKNIELSEKMDKLLRIILLNVSQAKSIIGNNSITKLLEDAEAACIEAKELNSKLYLSLPHSKLQEEKKLLDTVEIEIFAKKLEGKKILILEDEKAVARMLSSILEKNGAKVVYVEVAKQAVFEYKNAMRNNNKFDVVILDLVVSGSLGGTECFEKLLKLDPSVKAILSSGYCESVSKELRAKFAALLPKPYTYSELIRTVASVCD